MRIQPKELEPSSEVLSYLKSLEALRLTAYLDGGGEWTVGYGHTGMVKSGDKISRTRAEELFRADVGTAVACIRHWVKMPLHQREFDALVSFVFNIGGGQFSKSTMLKYLNRGHYFAAEMEFPRWNKDNGRTVRGLTIRREKERRWFTGSELRA